MSRLEDAKNKYPKINWEQAKTLDPSKNFKYLDWIGKNFRSKSDLKDLLTRFEKRKDSLEKRKDSLEKKKRILILGRRKI